MTRLSARLFATRLLCGVALAAAVPAIAQETGQQQQQTPARPTAPTLPTIAMGDTVQGEITAPATPGGCVANPRIRAWTFAGQAEQRLEITLQSEAFDTVVELGRMNGCEFESLARNDDGAGAEDGLNSRLTVRLRENGTYVVRATSFSDDGAGAFALAMRQLPPPAPEPTPMALTAGREVRGQLTNRDATIPSGEEGLSEGGRPYHLYALTGRAGERFDLALDANEFDPVLEAGSVSPLGYSMAQYNDDGGGPEDGLNSRMTITFRTAGTIVLRISPLGMGTGSYRLRANRASSSQ